MKIIFAVILATILVGCKNHNCQDSVIELPGECPVGTDMHPISYSNSVKCECRRKIFNSQN